MHLTSGYIMGFFNCWIVLFLPVCTALICYHCDKEYDLNRCKSLVECQSHEICIANRASDLSSRQSHTLGCIPKSICDRYIFGKRDLSTACCDSNYCNLNLVNTVKPSLESVTTTSAALSTAVTSTTPATTTTTAVTSTTSTAPTTTPSTTTKQLEHISCHLCRGPKFICERSHVSSKCLDPAQQFCINDVENRKDGSRYVTRRCATSAECNRDWLVESADRNECKNYNVVILQDAIFNCSFCCQGDDCNLETVPDNLYRGSH
ncbi:uncharacterized protein [Mytilus edulis]|uniref:uncharacterized protein isoform X2 n=1 Tax=Mytilus edulis TaxID=6550 RepID=UPI0039EFD989